MALLEGHSCRPRRRIGLLARILAGGVALTTPLGPATAGSSSLEDAIKATYIYKFAPFVAWPTSVPDTETFTICVLGTDPVAALLPQATAGQKIENKPIAIQQVGTDGPPPPTCRVLYLADRDAGASTLETARTRHILTIAEGGSADRHSIITLNVVEHHVQFDVDLDLANRSGLSISSKLLSLARTVTPSAAGRRFGE